MAQSPESKKPARSPRPRKRRDLSGLSHREFVDLIGSTKPSEAQVVEPANFPAKQILNDQRGTYYIPPVPAVCMGTWEALIKTDLDTPVWPGSDEYTESEMRARKASAYEAAGFAAGQRRNIEKLLLHRHGGYCDTDDGAVWLEDAIPFVVEEAEIRGISAIVAGLRWGRKFCPLVSLDEVAKFVVLALASRDEATAHRNETGRYMQWLPKGRDRKDKLLTRWGEVTAAGLKGMASIDRPPDEQIRDRKTGQREQQRRAQGVKPMKSRTLMKTRKMIADCFGVNVRTVQRWELKGVIPAENVQNLSPPCVSLLQGDTNWTFPLPANDDTSMAAGKVTRNCQTAIVSANDDGPTPPPAPMTAPLVETGYTGRNMSMSPSEVRAAIERHPALNDDLQRHFDAIDGLMSKTLAENHRRVRRNLLQDRNRLVLREQRAREKAAAVAVPMDVFTGQNISLSADEVGELAARYPALADRLHDHLAELEGPLSRIPAPSRKGALRRLVGVRSKLVRSAQRFTQRAA